MKNVNEQKVQSSLIPGIREQEGHLQEELQVVKAKAAQLLEQARHESQVSLEKVRGDFAASVDRLRAEGLQELRVSLETKKADAQDSIQQFEERTSARLPAAVQQIMTLVLPEGKA